MSEHAKNTPANTDGGKGPTLSLGAKEAAKALGIGQRLLWELTNRREIPHTRLGRRILYPVALLEKWLTDRAEGVR